MKDLKHQFRMLLMNKKDGNRGRLAEVTKDNALKVCLCEKCCDGSVKLKDLQKMYPGLKISIRDEQID